MPSEDKFFDNDNIGIDKYGNVVEKATDLGRKRRCVE